MYSKQTYYRYEIKEDNNIDSEYVELFGYKPGTTEYLENYWIASRWNRPWMATMEYGLFAIGESTINGNERYFSELWNSSNTMHIRPIVEIPISSVVIGAKGDGASAGTAYSIEKNN